MMQARFNAVYVLGTRLVSSVSMSSVVGSSVTILLQTIEPFAVARLAEIPQLRSERKPFCILQDHRSTPPKRPFGMSDRASPRRTARPRLPQRPSTIRRKLLGEGNDGSYDLSPHQRFEAARYVGRYNTHYKIKMLEEIQAMVRSPRAEIDNPEKQNMPRGSSPRSKPLSQSARRPLPREDLTAINLRGPVLPLYEVSAASRVRVALCASARSHGHPLLASCLQSERMLHKLEAMKNPRSRRGHAAWE